MAEPLDQPGITQIHIERPGRLIWYGRITYHGLDGPDVWAFTEGAAERKALRALTRLRSSDARRAASRRIIVPDDL